MNVKEYLSRYHKTIVKIKELEEIVAEYIRLANSIPGINFDQVRIDGTKSLQAPFEKWIIKALDEEAEIDRLKKELPKIKIEIMNLIDSVEDYDLKKVLIYRYIDWYSWNEIAAKMSYSYSTARRLHDKGTKAIKDNYCNKVEKS